jgi:DNA-binding transcriptional ArsR family regulator
MNTLFKALGDPRRLGIVQLIGTDELKAGDIAAHFGDVTRPAISQHLRVLVEAGVLAERREGTRRLYRVRRDSIGSVLEFFERFWDERLARLADAAEAEQRKEDDHGNA